MRHRMEQIVMNVLVLAMLGFGIMFFDYLGKVGSH